MFSRKPEADTRLAPSPQGNATAATFSILGPDITIQGNITAKADLHIEGKVEGDISCAALMQGDGSEIMGGVTAASARIAGRVHGSVSVLNLVILKTARIEGDVTYDSLSIEGGAQVDGKFARRTEEPRLALAAG